MDIAQHKLSLIERLMQVRRQVTLKKIEYVLIRSEMEARAEGSIEAIEKGEVIDFNQFKKNNMAWLKKNQTTK